MRRSFPFALVAATILGACADAAPTAVTSIDDSPTATATKDATDGHASVTVVLSGLNNPRGLAWGPDGALYVAEAGTATVHGPCATVPRGRNCFSGSGSISRLRKGKQERVATGLPSIVLITPTGPADVTGPHDVSFGKRSAYVTIGWGGPPAARAELGKVGAAFASLIRLTPNGKWRREADLGTFEHVNNPAGGPIDSNPFGLLVEHRRVYVADAGGNSILEVAPNGKVSLIATLPPTATGSEAVPTEVVRGPDGAFYVSQLTGGPFVAGAASVWRVVPGSAPQVYRSGFKTITDLDWGRDRTLYVLQFATGPVGLGGPGVLFRVRPNEDPQPIAEGLVSPTGVLAGPDGAVYVSNRGTDVGTGEVLRIVP